MLNIIEILYYIVIILCVGVMMFFGVQLTWNGGPDGSDTKRTKYKVYICVAFFGIIFASLIMYVCKISIGN